MNWAPGRVFARPAPCVARRMSGLVVLLSSTLAGCSSPEEPPITLQVGPDRILHFAPKSAYAQYFELPGEGDVLRIILASYPVPCKTYEPPGKGDVYVTVTIHSEPGKPLAGSEFSWEGLPVAYFSDLRPAPVAAQVPVEAPSPSWALPYVRLAQEGRPLPPGGHVKLSRFLREPFGIVEGEFKFSDAGDGEAATAALLGSFRVQLCHVELDPARATATPEEEKPKRR